MNTLKASFKIVTPMFLGDADQKASDIRPPSVKGALRFWWRAINWSRYLKLCNGRELDALRELHVDECEIFGSAAKDVAGITHGQSRVILKVTQPEKISFVYDWPATNTDSGYLTYGLGATREKPTPRDAIKEGVVFSLSILVRKKITGHKQGNDRLDDDFVCGQLKDCLIAIGLFGGLGARSRRANGSITIEKIDDIDIDIDLSTPEKYESEVNKWLNNQDLAETYPPFTALSKYTKWSKLHTAKDARKAHASLGQKYKEFRGIKSTLRGAVKVPFGLPLPNVNDKDRRSSPLIFHVHQAAPDSYVPSMLFMPAKFHPTYVNRDNDLTAFYKVVSDFVLSCKGR